MSTRRLRARHAVASSRLGTGFTLLEVLITLIILAVGMLGLANLQSKIHVTEMESYQRAHAVLLMQDMVDRINSNRGEAAEYADDVSLGADTEEDCTDATLDAVTDPEKHLARADRCEWSEALEGASEQRSGSNSGGMIGARGCIEQVTAPDATAGVCQAGVYRVTVVWQGLYATADSALECAADEYDAGTRRAISTQVSIGLPTCAAPAE